MENEKPNVVPASEKEGPDNFSLQKKKFFSQLALKNIPEIRLLFRGGKLWGKEDWRNVAEHCLVETAVAETLAESLDLPEDEKNELIKAAACHDWDKKLEISPDSFTDEERKKAENLLDKVQPDPKLMAATKPEFVVKALKEKSSAFSERLLHYIDDIARGNEIVNLDERIDEVQGRQPDLGKELEEELGGPFWDKERELGHQTEEEKIINFSQSGQGNFFIVGDD